MDKLARIYQLIGQLSKEERGQVAAFLKAGGGLAVQGAGDQSQDTDWLLAGFMVYLIRGGHIPRAGAYQSLTKRSAYKTYLEKLPAVMAYLSELEKQARTTTRHRPKLSFLCAGALQHLLNSWNVFTVSAMLTQIDKLPEAIESAFPGYVAGGVFEFVVNEMEEHSES